MTKRKIIEDALRALMDAEGRLTPAQVVEAAKAKDHPLHGYFEWNVKKAAQLHWLETASELIRSVQFRLAHNERIIVAPYFVRDPDRPANEQGYRSIQRIRTDSEAARDVLLDELILVAGIMKRSRAVAEVLGTAEDVERIEAMVQEFIVALKKRADEGPSPEA